MTAALEKPEGNSGTRERLLHTALKLYAAQGIHAVSLRRISAEAGSKNSAAMHYHFKNQSGVLEAIMTMLGRELKQIARGMPKVDHKSMGLRQACRDTLQPLVLLKTSQPWGADAVLFLSRIVSENDAQLADMVNAVYAPFWRRLDKALAKALPDLPAPTRRLRLMFITSNVIHGITEVEWLTHTPVGDLSHFNEDELLDHLVDYLIGGLEAPSFATQ
jgi:AcrR family transcriptional regulator